MEEEFANVSSSELTDAYWSSGFMIFFGVIFLIIFIPALLTLISVANTLAAVPAENRKMSPNQVWLVLIPVFGLIWQFIMVSRLADSLQAEFKKRNIVIKDEIRPAFNIGIANCILLCIPGYALLTVITMPIFWVKINKYEKLLNQGADVLDVEIH